MNRIYPPQDGSTGFLSAQFEVLGLTLITLNGLQEGDCVGIQRRILDGCETNEWIDYTLGCSQECVCYPQNQLFLAIPGQYRLMFGNRDDQELNDPNWFENATAYKTNISSSMDLYNYTQGDCDMAGCCSTGTSIAAIMPSATSPGWNVVMSDGSVLPIDLVAGDGIEITGNVITATGGSTDITDVIPNTDGTFTITDQNGDTVTVRDAMDCDCITLAPLGNGEYSITNGTDSTTIYLPTQVILNPDGVTYSINDNNSAVSVYSSDDCDCIVMTRDAQGNTVLDNGTITETILDTYGTASIATAAGTDSWGQPYSVGDFIVEFPDGTVGSWPAPPPAPIISYALQPTVGGASGTFDVTVNTDTPNNGIYHYRIFQSATTPTPSTATDLVNNETGTTNTLNSGDLYNIGSFTPSGSDDCYIEIVQEINPGIFSNVILSNPIAKPMNPFNDVTCWNLEDWTFTPGATSGDGVFTQDVGAVAFSTAQQNEASSNGCRLPLDNPTSDLTVNFRVPTIPDTNTDRLRFAVRFWNQQSPGGAQTGAQYRLVSSTFIPTAGQTFSDTVTPYPGSTHFSFQILGIDAHNGNPDVFTVDQVTWSNP